MQMYAGTADKDGNDEAGEEQLSLWVCEWVWAHFVLSVDAAGGYAIPRR